MTSSHYDIFIYCTCLSTDVDECESNPCENDATCTDAVNMYTCTCADGYTGTHCETGEAILSFTVVT